jgi:hypothetical protein
MPGRAPGKYSLRMARNWLDSNTAMDGLLFPAPPSGCILRAVRAFRLIKAGEDA